MTDIAKLAMVEIPGGTQYDTPPDCIHGTVYFEGTDKVFARCPSADDARTIVRTVNAHADLVKAMREAREMVAGCQTSYVTIVSHLNSALAKAEAI